MGFPAPPIVSLQHVAAGSARDRHLGWGVLVAADVVLALDRIAERYRTGELNQIVR